MNRLKGEPGVTELKTESEPVPLEEENGPKRYTGKKHLVEREDLMSMPYLIQSCYMDRIMKEINDRLWNGSLETILNRKLPQVQIMRRDVRLDRYAFWRLNRTDVLADLDLQISFPAETEGEIQEAAHLWMTLWFSFESMDIHMEVENVEPARDCFDRALIRLSNYLVPIMRINEIDRACEEMWTRYLPDAALNPKRAGAKELASAMGLQVLELRQYGRRNVRSTLYFTEKELRIQNETREGRMDDGSSTAMVWPNTIVVNLGADCGDERDLDIWHECFHYEFHLAFFRLQNMLSTDVGDIRKKKILVDAEKYKSPTSRMEFEAWWGSYALMMPLGFIQPVLEDEYEKAHKAVHAGGYEKHEGFLYSVAIRSIAEKYTLSKARIRTRLLLLKHTGAKGALNWADGHYIRAFAFSAESCGQGQTFTIDREGVWKLYQKDKAFRTVMQTGQFVYVDGHVCINDPDYIIEYNHRMELSPWANGHVDQVCLRFNQKYERSRPQYTFGEMNCCQEYNTRYNEFLDAGGKLTGIEILKQRAEYLKHMPDTFPEAFQYVRKGRMSIEDLAVESHVSHATIERWGKKEQRQYDVDKLVAICVALHMPPWLSQELLKRANLTVQRSGTYGYYGLILDCYFMDSVDEVQEMLENNGLPRLNVAE